MTREAQLIDKIKGLVRRARLPRFFNRYGRKWHPTRQLVLCHAVYALYARCWRRAAKFMREFYGITMTFSCWRKAILKIPSWAWDALARASAGDKPCALTAIDGTTLARSNPSQHYYQRILGGKTARPTQQLLMIDVQRRKFLAWRFRSHQRGETIDVPYLLRHTPVTPSTILMDKGFDAEWLHEWLDQRGVWSIAPTRAGCRYGRHRRQLRDAVSRR